MSYAIIQTGGKQYRVAEGDVLDVEKLPLEAGQSTTTHLHCSFHRWTERTKYCR
jgi:ribosomal protein L21